MGIIRETSHDSTFRVWAPHADHVFITGTFNQWSLYRTPLAAENNGYWSVDVPHVKTDDEYKFVIRRDGQTLVRTDPYARDVKPGFQNGVVVNGEYGRMHDSFQMPPINELVVYELHVGTFAAADGNPPGNFEGVIEKLPYLRQLGINVIELMPVSAFPGDFSWGYNPSHPFAISRVYGGYTGLQRLTHAAHQYGIGVIVDVVYNHFGPQELSLWQFDGWQESGKGGIYFYNDWRSKTPWADTRPDYGRFEVRQFIRDNVMMWYEVFGVDGLRWDATSYIRNAHGHDGDAGADIPEGWGMMAAINDEVNGRFPKKLHIAEDLQGNAWITKPTFEGGAGFHSQWDTNFVHPIRHAIITPHDEDRDMNAIRDAILFQYNGSPFDRIIYTESHDEVANGKARVPEEIAPDDQENWFARKRATLGAGLVFTAPGVPMIFQGQEFLEVGWFDDHKALDWQKVDTNHEILQLFQDLIRLRRNLGGQTKGLVGLHVHVHCVDNGRKLIAFHRWDQGGPGDDVIVVANFSHIAIANAQIGFPHAGEWHLRFDSNAVAYGINEESFSQKVILAIEEGAQGMDNQAVMQIAPYSLLIYSQESNMP
ncbi:MAG: 1,4-alpha-glucan branching protein [Chloroflexi bacterium]|nr:MAG: 1,4-alpha-glucan branching protein [Chloroflexota bacterium]